MKVKKVPVKEPESSEEESMEEEEADSGAGNSEEDLNGLSEEAEDSDDNSSDDDDDDDVPQTSDPVAANQKVIDEMDGSSDEAPEEKSSKITKVKGAEKTGEKKTLDEEVEEKKPAYDKSDESRTVFCGNIPNAPNINETRLKDLFRYFCDTSYKNCF